MKGTFEGDRPEPQKLVVDGLVENTTTFALKEAIITL
jgi:hypothetical protein